MEKIWVLGDAVVDLLPDGKGRLLQCPGGAPANVAVGIARLGGKSAFIGRVGDDPFGRFMQKMLADEQVDVQWMRRDPQHRTSTVVVDLDEQGERSFTFMVRPSADLFLTSDDLPPFQVNGGARMMNYTPLKETCEALEVACNNEQDWETIEQLVECVLEDMVRFNKWLAEKS